MSPSVDTCRHCGMSRLSCVGHAMRFEGIRCCTHCTHGPWSFHRSDLPFWGVLFCIVASAVLWAVLVVKEYL